MLFSPNLMGPAQRMGQGSLYDLLAQQQPQQPQGGLGSLFSMDAFKQNVGDLLSPDVALPAAAAMLMGTTPAESFGGAFQMAGAGLKTKRERNRTLSFLQQKHPEIAAMVEAGMPIGEAWTAALKKSKAGSDVNYSLTPVYGTDPVTGKKVLGVVGSDGTFKRLDTGDFDVAAGIEKVDVGTKYILYDKRTGQPVGEEPKDLRGAEREKEIGTAEGKSAAAAGGDFQASQNAIALVDELLADPNRQRGTGFSGWAGNWIPSTGGYDYQNKVDQAKAGAFLSAIQQLRGMGALSNAEGDTATKAITRMDTATTEEAFVDALMEYRRIVEQGQARAQRAAGKYGVDLPPANAPAPSAGGTNYKQKYGLD